MTTNTYSNGDEAHPLDELITEAAESTEPCEVVDDCLLVGVCDGCTYDEDDDYYYDDYYGYYDDECCYYEHIYEDEDEDEDYFEHRDPDAWPTLEGHEFKVVSDGIHDGTSDPHLTVAYQVTDHPAHGTGVLAHFHLYGHEYRARLVVQTIAHRGYHDSADIYELGDASTRRVYESEDAPRVSGVGSPYSAGYELAWRARDFVNSGQFETMLHASLGDWVADAELDGAPVCEETLAELDEELGNAEDRLADVVRVDARSFRDYREAIHKAARVTNPVARRNAEINATMDLLYAAEYGPDL